MGGNSKGATAPTTSDPIKAVQPEYLKNTHETLMPQAMPGQLSALAQQLGIGFGLPSQVFGKALEGTYSSPKTLAFSPPPASVTPKVDPKKKVDPTKPSDKFTYVGGRNAR